MVIAAPFARQFRNLQRWYAHTFHYYWLPCPVCGVMTGGHETMKVSRYGLIGSIPDKGPGTGKIICPECAIQGYGWYPAADAVRRGMRSINENWPYTI